MTTTATATSTGSSSDADTPLRSLPASYSATRDALQRVATHVLARRRHALSGTFGLRATPRGFGTPASGPEHEVVRVAGTRLVRETTGTTAATRSLDLAGATLRQAAELVGVDLDAPFEAGHDTPPLGAGETPLAIDPVAALALAEWFAFGWEVLDDVLAALEPCADPTVIQIWPEHFDVGVDVAAAPGRRVNLGVSPGDSFSDQPYIYVGPWDVDRPSDSEYWNAPFGAVLTYDHLRVAHDAAATGRAFLLRGVDLLGEGAGA